MPPRDVIIMDEYGQRIEETVGPIDEGSNVTLICEAEGGTMRIFLFHAKNMKTAIFLKVSKLMLNHVYTTGD